MSLKHIADHLAAQGRGGDTTLVHMAPSEVKNLQGIARLHGGSLTINPKTGLPEADFLRAILPTLEGAALVAGSGGSIDPAMAAMMVGGFNAVQSGSIMQGLSAGMGAYGGGNLATGMTFAGEAPRPGEIADLKEAALTNTPTPAPVVVPAPTPATALDVPVSGAVSTPVTGNWGNLPVGEPYAGDLTSLNPYPTAGVGQTYGEFGNVVPDTSASNFAPDVNQSAAETARLAQQNVSAAGVPVSQAAVPSMAAPTSNWDVLKNNMTAKNMMYAFGPAVASELMQPRQMAGTPTPAKHGTTQAPVYTAGVNPASFENTDMSGRGRRYFDQSYTPGVYYAEGGPVEQMSNQNAIGTNTQYPQADLHSAAYATPWQTPVSENVLQGPQDTNIDPYTGEQRFAEGGIARLASGGKSYAEQLDMVSNAPAAARARSLREAPAQDYTGYYQHNQLQPQANTAGISGYAQGPRTQALQQGYRYDPAQVQAIQAARASQANSIYNQPYKSLSQRRIEASGPGMSRVGAVLGETSPDFGGHKAAQEYAAYMDWQSHQGQKAPAQYYNPSTGSFSSTPVAAPVAQNLAAPAAPTGISGYGSAPSAGIAGYNAAPAAGAAPVGKAAGGGISTLGGYSDGGRLLKGPGDGMSDNIPAQIGQKQPARLADGEFVVPADVVSHLGNGSTDAGAKQLYKMMDKVRAARTGRKAQGKQINPNKFMPA